MNFLYKRKSLKKEAFDEDCLVDYDEKDNVYHDKFKFYSKCKHKFSPSPIIQYTTMGTIKRPVYSNGSRACYLPITQEIIESILLKQHCKISKEEDVRWFKDGITWLAQQQFKETPYINQESLQTFERACEAYFGIPISLCEDNWASEYLLSQASKTKFLSRVLLFKKPSIRKPSFSIKKYLCLCL